MSLESKCEEGFGRTLTEALEDAARKAGLKQVSNLIFEIIEKKENHIKIKLYLDKKTFKEIEDLVKETLGKVVDIRGIVVSKSGKFLNVNITCRGKTSYVIGKSGVVLDAWQYILNLMARRKETLKNYRLIFDINGYRQKRIRFLKDKAVAVAEQVKNTGIEMRLDPIDERDLKYVKEALRGCKDVRYYIIRQNDKRVVVIAPKNY